MMLSREGSPRAPRGLTPWLKRTRLMGPCLGEVWGLPCLGRFPSMVALLILAAAPKAPFSSPLGAWGVLLVGAGCLWWPLLCWIPFRVGSVGTKQLAGAEAQFHQGFGAYLARCKPPPSHCFSAHPSLLPPRGGTSSSHSPGDRAPKTKLCNLPLQPGECRTPSWPGTQEWWEPGPQGHHPSGAIPQAILVTDQPPAAPSPGREDPPQALTGVLGEPVPDADCQGFARCLQDGHVTLSPREGHAAGAASAPAFLLHPEL